MTTAIVEYSQTEAALSELAHRYKGVVYDVTTPAGMSDARKGRAEVRSYRVALEKTRVEIKGPALKHCQLIDSEARRITTELCLLEDPIDDQIRREENKKEEARLAAEAAEAARIAAEQQAVKDAEERRMAAERANIARRQAELDRTEREAREKIETAERESRRKIEEEGRAARAKQDEADRQERLARQGREEAERARRAAEEARLKEERDKVEAARRAVAERERKEREAEEARQREAQRQQNEILDGWAMLATFVKRFGAIAEFSPVVAEIKKHLRARK